ncbi:sensor histidine kinase [Oceanirhabdus sp. W0125-5]|uniref:sensor histidine kinase n=1 Tax=Oceanirhabdus sp. W0125-5 TaxID=2999116 RepID=UPI0022F2D6D6|nr:sensor histidine kinase [Oceanirhabdus sp. W0125-5]WBW96730.1 sensor histidine kinase [Oceanirhabdus sp. W0125-5]
MNKFQKYNDFFRNGLLIIIVANVALKYKNTPSIAILYGGIFLAAILNDNLRYERWFNNEKKYIISLITSIGLCFFLMIMAGGNTIFYSYFLLYDIIVLLDEKKGRIFFIIHLSINIFVISIYLNLFNNIFSLSYWKDNLINYVLYLLIYLVNIFSFMSIKFNIREKSRVKKLNNELQEANEKLKEYSLKVEELTIKNERNRVAQEIHDSLGHSLTALIMHLDFLEKVIDKKPEKAKEVVIKSQDIARNSMKDVRRAIYALKDNEISKGLLSSIENLIENLTVSQGIKFDCNIVDESIENIEVNIKNIIYITIKESITNGIKHGQASSFFINLEKTDKDIKLKIQDNGKGCENVVLGNGLKGMKDRIDAVSGQIDFSGNKDGGFEVEVYIPA